MSLQFDCCGIHYRTARGDDSKENGHILISNCHSAFNVHFKSVPSYFAFSLIYDEEIGSLIVFEINTGFCFLVAQKDIVPLFSFP